MAGIGFRLHRYLSKNNYTGLFSAYFYAGAVASGPWLLSIITILVLTQLVRFQGVGEITRINFQVTILYLIMSSLIFSAIFQHTYTRYIADECFINRRDQIVPTLNSVFLVLTLIAGLFSLFLTPFLLPDQALHLQILFNACFIILSLIWVTLSVLSGLIAFNAILLSFFIGFVVSIASGLLLFKYELEGLLFSFLLGQSSLLIAMIAVIYRYYPTKKVFNYDFFKYKSIHKSLIFTGVFYNIGIWIDKIIFWYHPATGVHVIGRMYQSVIYDVPIFIAYLSIIPAMSVFLLRLEVDYAYAHENLYRKINGDSTLADVHVAYLALIKTTRSTIISILKTNAYVIFLLITAAGFFAAINISPMYLPLIFICLLSGALNILFWGVLNIIFYLNKIKEALFLTFFFMVSNALLTLLSIELGVFFFGYGLLVSLLLSVVLSFVLLNREVDKLQYETYMLQTP